MKILLACSSGMSTSLLVNKMKEAAQAEGIEAEIFWDETPETAVTTRQQSRLEGVNRYSNRRDSAMTLRGIKGKVWFDGANEDTMKLLFAGELLHIGKNSSFGFGEYQVMW